MISCPLIVYYSYSGITRRLAEDIENVEVIFIDSSNWLKTFAPPVLSFLRKVDLRGKTIIPFCTHGGGGFGRKIEDYKKECKKSIIKAQVLYMYGEKRQYCCNSRGFGKDVLY